MKKRKHRLVVEMTTSHPMTERKAAAALSLLLHERLDTQARPIWATPEGQKGVYCDKLSVKQFSKVALPRYVNDK